MTRFLAGVKPVDWFAVPRRYASLARGGGWPSVTIGRGSRQPTFDIFETLVTSHWLSGRSLLLHVARVLSEEGICDVSPPAFVRARSRASDHASRTGHELPFEVLWEGVRRDLGFTHHAVRQAMSRELSVTAGALYVVPAGRRRLEAARELTTQGTVVFISDIYLPGGFLRDRLRAFGLWQDGDRIWTSCEADCRKGDGGLFRLVRAYEGDRRTRYVHTGDRPLEDQAAARWVGFRPKPLTVARSTQVEQLLTSGPKQSLEWWGAVAGALRFVRLSGDGLLPAWGTGVVQLVGPLSAVIACRALGQARTLGSDRIQVSPEAAFSLPVLGALARSEGVTPLLQVAGGVIKQGESSASGASMPLPFPAQAAAARQGRRSGPLDVAASGVVAGQPAPTGPACESLFECRTLAPVLPLLDLVSVSVLHQPQAWAPVESVLAAFGERLNAVPTAVRQLAEDVAPLERVLLATHRGELSRYVDTAVKELEKVVRPSRASAGTAHHPR